MNGVLEQWILKNQTPLIQYSTPPVPLYLLFPEYFLAIVYKI